MDHRTIVRTPGLRESPAQPVAVRGGGRVRALARKVEEQGQYEGAGDKQGEVVVEAHRPIPNPVRGRPQGRPPVAHVHGARRVICEFPIREGGALHLVARQQDLVRDLGDVSTFWGLLCPAELLFGCWRCDQSWR